MAVSEEVDASPTIPIVPFAVTTPDVSREVVGSHTVADGEGELGALEPVTPREDPHAVTSSISTSAPRMFFVHPAGAAVPAVRPRSAAPPYRASGPAGRLRR